MYGNSEKLREIGRTSCKFREIAGGGASGARFGWSWKGHVSEHCGKRSFCGHLRHDFRLPYGGGYFELPRSKTAVHACDGRSHLGLISARGEKSMFQNTVENDRFEAIWSMIVGSPTGVYFKRAVRFTTITGVIWSSFRLVLKRACFRTCLLYTSDAADE